MEFTEKVKTGDEKLDFSLQATTDLDFCILEYSQHKSFENAI